MPRVKVEEKTDEICDLCDLPMVIKTSRFGRFLACTGFPECRGKKSLLKSTGVTCPECNNSQLVERRGKGRTFYGCTAYPECTFTVSQRPLPEPCPECEGLLVASGRDNARCLKCAYRGPVPERELTEVGA
jgi:DNA topoisomerase-1